MSLSPDAQNRRMRFANLDQNYLLGLGEVVDALDYLEGSGLTHALLTSLATRRLVGVSKLQHRDNGFLLAEVPKIYLIVILKNLYHERYERKEVRSAFRFDYITGDIGPGLRSGRFFEDARSESTISKLEGIVRPTE